MGKNLNLKQIENMNKPIIKMALAMIDSVREQLINGECNELDIQETMTKFHPESHGYVKEDDFVNYDKALKILGLSNNRAKLNQLCKKYGIKNVKFNNASIGFPKKDIERLAVILKNKQSK